MHCAPSRCTKESTKSHERHTVKTMKTVPCALCVHHAFLGCHFSMARFMKIIERLHAGLTQKPLEHLMMTTAPGGITLFVAGVCLMWLCLAELWECYFICMSMCCLIHVYSRLRCFITFTCPQNLTYHSKCVPGMKIYTLYM